MRNLIRGLAPAVMIAGIAVASFAATASARPSGRCEESLLAAKMSVIHGSSGAGHIEYRLTVKNHGPTCAVHEHPGLILLGSGGAHLPTHVSDQGHGGIVAIRPGETVSSKLRFSPDIAGPGEPSHGACEPAAHHVKVILTQSISVVGPVEPPTSVCGHGAITEEPLS